MCISRKAMLGISQSTHKMANQIKLPKLLDRSFKLEIEQIVYVPSTKDADKKLSNEQFHKRIKMVETYLSKMFGGKSSTKVSGGYYSDDKHKMINEEIVKVTSYATVSAYNKNKNKLMKQIQKWNRSWGQEATAYEIEGDLYYIN